MSSWRFFGDICRFFLTSRNRFKNIYNFFFKIYKFVKKIFLTRKNALLLLTYLLCSLILTYTSSYNFNSCSNKSIIVWYFYFYFQSDAKMLIIWFSWYSNFKLNRFYSENWKIVPTHMICYSFFYRKTSHSFYPFFKKDRKDKVWRIKLLVRLWSIS